MTNANLLAISDITINRKFVIFADYMHGFYFTDHVDEDVLRSIPRIIEDVEIRLDHGSPELCTLSYWVKPFQQEMYEELLMEYARIECGKATEYGNNSYMLKDGWTEYKIKI